MRPVIRRFLYLVIGVASLVGLASLDCGNRERWKLEPGRAPLTFEKLPGEIGIRIGDRIYLVRNGLVSVPGTLPAADPHAVSGGGEGGLVFLPKIEGYRIRYDGPYSKSPDREMFVAAADVPETWYLTPVLLLISSETNSVLFSRYSNDEWEIRSVAWSPDSRYFAALRVEAEFGYCLFEIVAHALGYPSELNTYFLDIYDLDGTVVASMEIAAKVHLEESEIIWMDRPGPG